jgi:hypothetical protein
MTHVRGRVVNTSNRKTATARQERLSRETIADSAIALADSEGLEAVTIRRLAQHHNVRPTAVEPPEGDDSPWPQQLRAVLEAFPPHLRR